LQVYAGEKWIDRIMDELKKAKVVLLMLTNTSVKRPWVNFEAGAAWTREIAIVPVCFRGLTKDDLPKPYSSLQAVDLKAYGDDEYLARSVAHYLGVREPMGRMYSMYGMGAVAVLSGQEAGRQVEREHNAYEQLKKRLKELDSLRSD
jgi:hypothetical protein